MIEPLEIICVPTGEVFSVNHMQFYNLFENDLIRMNYEKEFWYFEYDDIGMVKSYITKK